MQGGSDAQLSVEQAVSKAQTGDAASFAALYEHFYAQIFRYVSFKTGNPDEAEDVTAEVFVRMLESIHTFRWKGYQFSSWLYRIAHNLVMDHFRKSGRKKTVALENAARIAGDSSQDLDHNLDVNLTMQEVRGAMEGLTDLQKQVISLRFAAGLSVSETARAVGKKDNAVKALQHAGLKKLRSIMAAESPVPATMRRSEV